MLWASHTPSLTIYSLLSAPRLVFHCLLELARCRAKGIVEHAACLGAPVGVTPERWALARSVVAGRLVNGYSSQDWVRCITALPCLPGLQRD